MENSVIPLRWSSVTTFGKCPRKYDLVYNQNLAKRPTTETRARILGSTVHAGIRAALQTSFDDERADEKSDLVAAALEGVREYHRANLVSGKTVYDYETGLNLPDTDYYAMMTEVFAQASNILEYQIPRIGLGTLYRVADEHETGCGSYFDDPMIEWTFSKLHHVQDRPYDITGTIDCVLQDVSTGEYIVWDWKTRGVMPTDLLIDMDGQLRLYAAILNSMGANITRTCQYQLLSHNPKPAQITTAKKQISMANISSTWEVWAESVEAMGEDPAQYEEQMRPKMKDATAFTKPVFSPVTPFSSQQIINQVLQVGEMIRFSGNLNMYPGIGSSMGCQFCEFKKLCKVIDFGGDIKFVQDTEYEFGIEAVEDEVIV